MNESSLRIVHLYPHLLGTYGDAGNSIVLRARAQARAVAAEVVLVNPGDPVPRQGDVYLLGGGEDAKQTAAAQELRQDGGLVDAAGRGAAVFGICAGYQLLGTTFLGVGGAVTDGLGLLDVSTDRLDTRAVGNMLARPSAELGLPELIGFENHGGATILGPRAMPLGVVEIGIGNGSTDPDGRRTEGAIQGHVVGTYLHGPALALNPALADRLLAAVLGPLEPLDDTLPERLREHRLQHVLPATQRAARRRTLADRLRRRRSGPSGATATLSARPSGP
jgi:lipid II isoglutaminyl synthase (glutamine-hydrolysing)